MRTFIGITLSLFLILLFIVTAEFSGLLPASLSWWETWLLRSAVLVLCIGIFVSAARLRSLALQQQSGLEVQVAQRTEELRIANQELENEIEQRKRAEAALARQAEERLSVSEARFQAMFNDSAVGMGIMGLDRRILDANPAICRMFGRSREELIGMNAAEATYADDNPESDQLFHQLTSGRNDSYEVDRRYVRKNGEVFWAHVTMSSVNGPDGQPRFLVGMVIDIDQQKRAEEELRQSEARFRAVFESASVGVALMGLDRRIQAVNQAAQRITGYTEQEMKSRPATEFAVEEDRQLDQPLLQEIIEGRRDQYVIEKRYLRKDGSMFWGRVNFSAIRDPDGQIQYLIGLIEDISEQKRAAETLAAQAAEHRRMLEQRVEARTHELQQSNRRLQEEVSQRQQAEMELAKKAAAEAVSAERTRLARDLHDAVTQTLFSASLTAEVLPELWALDIEEARKTTEELRQLTRGALAEMRTLLLELRPAALTQARFEDLLKQLTEALIGRTRLPIDLAVEGERSLPADVQVALYRIAQESLNNVIKYAHAGRIGIHLILSADGARMEISDNGQGFEINRIKPASLGMRIMRERAQAIGADFQVTSRPGKGTLVRVRWKDTAAKGQFLKERS